MKGSGFLGLVNLPDYFPRPFGFSLAVHELQELRSKDFFK